MVDRDRAWALLNEYVTSDSLIKHCLSVEAAMRQYSQVLGGDAELWGVTGLLHDFDYERWPTAPEHTRKGAEVLRNNGFDEEMVGAILSHADWNQKDYPRDRPIRKALYAVDELCGLIMATALMRPGGLEEMKAKSVKKKMKQKSFAAGVNRDDIHLGVALLETDLDTHIDHCILAMQGIQNKLGLADVSREERGKGC